MKKLFALSAGAVMLLSSAAPAFAAFNTATIIGNDVKVEAKSGSVNQDAAVVTKGSALLGRNFTMSAPSSITQSALTGVAVADGKQVIASNVNVCMTCANPSMNNAVILGNDLKVEAKSGKVSQDAVAVTKGTAGFMGSNMTIGGPATVVQAAQTGDAGASGDQWIVSNVNVGLLPLLLD